MKCNDLKISEQAKADIVNIVEYIAKDNKQIAQSVSIYLYRICSLLVDFPELGVERPDFTYKDYRFYIVKKRYIIAYKVVDSILFVSRVLSNYQDICEQL